MKEKMLNWMYGLNIFQLLVYLLGFYNWAAATTDHAQLFNTNLNTLSGIFYWSILSMIAVVGVVLSIYLLVQKAFDNKIGLIISLLAFLSPILFMFFLIIPATFSLLAVIFLKVSASEQEGEE